MIFIVQANQNLTLMHASAVAMEGHGILISGPSGIGKSALTMDLLFQGHGFDYVLLNNSNYKLVSDDQTYVGKVTENNVDYIIAKPHPNLEGLLEVRGLGIIEVPFKASNRIDLWVEIVDKMPPRMPEKHLQSRPVLGINVPYIQIYKNDMHSNARVMAALYAHNRNKIHSNKA